MFAAPSNAPRNSLSPAPAKTGTPALMSCQATPQYGSRSFWPSTQTPSLVYSLFNGFWWLLPWLSLYACGYTYISFLSIHQAWEKRGALRHGLAAVREAGD